MGHSKHKSCNDRWIFALNSSETENSDKYKVFGSAFEVKVKA